MAEETKTCDESEKPVAISNSVQASSFYLGPLMDAEEQDETSSDLRDAAAIQQSLKAFVKKELRFSHQQQSTGTTVTKVSASARLLGVSSDTVMTTASTMTNMVSDSVECANGITTMVRRACSTSTLRLKKKRSEFWRKMQEYVCAMNLLEQLTSGQ